MGDTGFEVVDVITGASPNFTELTSNLRDQGNQGEFLATVVTGLAGEYRETSNESISLAEATGRGVDEYRNATDAIKELAAAYEAWNDMLSSFDANTEAGRNVREALSGASQATMDWVDTLPSSERSAGVQLARDRVYDMALEMGLSSEAAAAWADEVALSAGTVSAAASGAAAQTPYLRDMFNSLPSNVQTDIRTNGFPQTEAEVDALIANYPSLEGKRETIIALQAQAATAGVRSYLGYVRQVQGTRVTTIITR